MIPTNPPPTERLILKPISLKDLEKIHELHLLPETDRYNTLGIPKNITETEEIIKDWITKHEHVEPRYFTFKIALYETNDFVGLIALNLGNQKFKNGEIWYKLHVDFWGNGYATEAVKAILNFGFDALSLHRIEAGCAVKNTSSINVLEKVGMTREGQKRKVLPLKEGWSDNFEYAILESDIRQ